MRTLRLSLAGTVMLTMVGGIAAMTLAQEDPAALEGPHYITGQSWPDIWERGSSEHDAERGVLEQYGWRYSDRVEMDDPRLTGTAWSVRNDDATSSSVVSSGTIALVNDAGSWVGTGRGYIGAEPRIEHFFFELTGTGDYTGHSALLYWYGAPDEAPWDIDGFVFPDVLPPFPDPVDVLTE